MNIIRIGLLQLVSQGPDQEANRLKGEKFCRQAKEMGADIALFPEMWNIGYWLPSRSDPGEQAAWRGQAIDEKSAFIAHFQNLARELNLAIALTYLEKGGHAPRNSTSVIDRLGEIVLTYAKVHTCDFDREAALEPGEDFSVCSLDTVGGPLEVGVMTCFDREFPESARILMLKGAELILVPNACNLEANRIGQLRARAYENMTAVATANYAAPQENGHSVVFDGIAFDEQEGSRDTCLVEAGEAEGVVLAELDLDGLRRYRAHEAWGNAYRKPRLYGSLIDPLVKPPFERGDARR
jgi:N-carbamoylputrescine amidase